MIYSFRKIIILLAVLPSSSLLVSMEHIKPVPMTLNISNKRKRQEEQENRDTLNNMSKALLKNQRQKVTAEPTALKLLNVMTNSTLTKQQKSMLIQQIRTTNGVNHFVLDFFELLFENDFVENTSGLQFIEDNEGIKQRVPLIMQAVIYQNTDMFKLLYPLTRMVKYKSLLNKELFLLLNDCFEAGILDLEFLELLINSGISLATLAHPEDSSFTFLHAVLNRFGTRGDFEENCALIKLLLEKDLKVSVVKLPAQFKDIQLYLATLLNDTKALIALLAQGYSPTSISRHVPFTAFELADQAGNTDLKLLFFRHVQKYIPSLPE